jgi:adenylyltransferase/sulfurtransferase
LIVDCTDNFAAKFLLNDIAQQLRKTVLFASVYQFEGQLQVVRGGTEGACLRCVWPEATRDGLVGNCAEAGVLGPVPGVLGSLQALEALKLLLQIAPPLGDDVLMMDLLTLSTTRIRARRAPACTAGTCARASAARSTDVAALEVSFDSLAQAVDAGYRIVDIREPQERLALPLGFPDTLEIPMATLLGAPSQLASDDRYLLVCARGSRSLATAAELSRRGFTLARSLRGGAAALSTQIA